MPEGRERDPVRSPTDTSHTTKLDTMKEGAKGSPRHDLPFIPLSTAAPVVWECDGALEG